MKLRRNEQVRPDNSEEALDDCKNSLTSNAVLAQVFVNAQIKNEYP
jgi:hypothetical protein